MEPEKSEKDLIVDVTSQDVNIALMENHRLIELNKESSKGHNFSVGDVYLGKVKKLLPALNAAFVDIGDKKEAFVHYLDLGLYFNAFDEFVRKSNPNTDLGQLYSKIKIGPILEKEGRIENVLKPGQMMIVQIVKKSGDVNPVLLLGCIIFGLVYVWCAWQLWRSRDIPEFLRMQYQKMKDEEF